MEKNIKELIAEMDRIEALEPNEDNQMQEGFADTLKGVMDKIANKLGYQPKDPELADLFKKYEQHQQELHRLAQEIEAHPEFGDEDLTAPADPRQGVDAAPQDRQDTTGAVPDPGMEPMGSPRSPQN